MDALSILIIVGGLLAFGVILYLLIAIPMMGYQKKEIKAFTNLAEKLKFEIKPGKVSLKPNFPIIKGFFQDHYFIVQKAIAGKFRIYNSATNSTTSRTKWILKISTKLKIPENQSFNIINRKVFRKEIELEDFQAYFKITVNNKETDLSFSDEIKMELIKLWLETKNFEIVLDKQILYTSNYHGLVNDKDVEHCRLKIILLEKIAVFLESQLGTQAPK